MREMPLPRCDQAMPVLPPARLKACGLVYSVDGRRLIDGLDLALPARGITVIMGPNGAGKSLTLRLLNGLLTPQDGTVVWDGAPLNWAARVCQAMVFQKPVLLRRSVAANVDFVLRARDRTPVWRRAPWRRDTSDRDALLGRVGLLDHAAQPARRLSGGEQQRLALARALALQPQVLLLDEPTASLDPASAQMIEQIVQDACRSGTKVILVTHDIGQARRLADDVAFVARGRVTEHACANTFFDAPATPEAQAYLAGRLVL